MRRLVCTFVVRKPPRTGFLASRPRFIFRLIINLRSCQVAGIDHIAKYNCFGSAICLGLLTLRTLKILIFQDIYLVNKTANNKDADQPV